MHHAQLLGFALVVAAALAGGGIAYPLKKRRAFELENFYLPTSFTMMILLPILISTAVAPAWFEALRQVDAWRLWIGAIFGLGWGTGAILYGYGVSQAGISVGCTVIMGVNTAFGSLLPFFMHARIRSSNLGSLLILTGIAACIGGVAICGRAGYLRDRKSCALEGRSPIGSALAICVASGALSSSANLGFDFCGMASKEVQKFGTNPTLSTVVCWIPVCWGAATVLLLWFGGLQIKKGTWRKNFGPGTGHDLLMSLSMGVIWFAATIPYGMGAHLLGRLGTSVGWAVTNAAALASANTVGFLTHEWVASTKQIRGILYEGLALLLGAGAILAIGNSIVNSP